MITQQGHFLIYARDLIKANTQTLLLNWLLAHVYSLEFNDIAF